MAIDDFRPFPAAPAIYDRSLTGERDRVWFPELDGFAQAADINEAFSLEAAKRTRIGNLLANDGDRIEGADIIVDQEEGTITLAAGRIYVMGDVREIGEASFEDVPMAGETRVGVRVTSLLVDADADPDLLGLHPGTLAEGEPGGIREVKSLEWGWENEGDSDGGEGDLFQVYLVSDGYVVDQAPPPSLSGFTRAIADYDYQALGNYIARGCEVTALGSDGDGGQLFSVEAGVANILGFKRTRQTATRAVIPEEPDLRFVTSEPHTYVDDGGSAVITVRRPPINGVETVVVTKQTTEVIVRGGSANGTDALSNTGVSAIVSVTQGETTFVATTDYVQSGDGVSWAPGGAEPAGGSSYSVTYRYLSAVEPDSIDARTITVSDGVDGQPVFVTYSYKRPRYDRLCFNSDGQIVYIKGIPTDDQPKPPPTPESLLSLAVVQNDWFGTPVVVNDGTRAIPFETQTKFFNRLLDLLDLAALDRLQADISFREPVAKYGLFVDPLTSDRYRDAGEAQDGSVFNGTLQITIDPTFEGIALNGPQFLDFTAVPIIVQDFVTGCMRINPYQNFTPPPPEMVVRPARDFWTESNTTWLSPITQEFGWNNPGRVVTTEVVTTETQARARFLRQIEVNFTISKLGEGETLDELTFDGIDVTPAGPLEADGNGVITGSFTIPANVTSGTKALVASTGGNRRARARFTGEGRIDTLIRQRVTTILNGPQLPDVEPPVRERPEPPQPPGPLQPSIIDWTGEVMQETGFSPDGPDPLAQSFSLVAAQHITGIDVRFCRIGDRTKDVICEIVTMENGYPTTAIIAQTSISMQPVTLNTWRRFTFPVPVFLPADQQFAFVFKTDDADHSLAIARRGGFDTAKQRFVAAQPYTVGVLFSSSNAITWTAHQDEDLAFRIFAARFEPAEKIVNLGTVAAVDLTDFMMEAAAFLPTGAARVLFEVQPAGETAVRLEPGQVWERQSAFTGNVTLRMILRGNSRVSPIVGRDLLAILGSMRTSGTYVSRAWGMGDDVRVDAIMKTRLPSGSTMTVSVDAGDGDWEEMAQVDATVLADGTLERRFSEAGWSADNGRIKIELTGTPAARPSVSDLRAFTVI